MNTYKNTPPLSSPKVIVITGPTASGKTAVGAALAKTIGGEVVSADSMQIYKHMDIGTAKPTAQEMMGVPHHMIDIAEPWESYSAARYIKDASACINDIQRRNKTAVLVGGTGLYIDSLISGREFSARADSGLRKTLEEKYDKLGGEAMLLELSEFDPISAAKLYANDKKRIVRAFEVYKTTGKTISQHDIESKSFPPRYETLRVSLTFMVRADLYERIDRRVDNMLHSGLEGEVKSLLNIGVSPSATSMQAIGYKEIASVISGKSDLKSAVSEIKMQSRRYAKRQLSWLRRDNNAVWVTWDKTPDIEKCAAKITELYEKN